MRGKVHFDRFEETTQSRATSHEHKSILVRLDSSRNHCCNMALWKALALLSMMIPAVVSKRSQAMSDRGDAQQPSCPLCSDPLGSLPASRERAVKM